MNRDLCHGFTIGTSVAGLAVAVGLHNPALLLYNLGCLGLVIAVRLVSANGEHG